MSNHLDPDWESVALITVDIQRDLLDGRPHQIPGTSAAAKVAAAVCEVFRRARRPIVHIVRHYRNDGSNVDPCRRSQVKEGMSLAIAGSEDVEIAPGLTPPGAALDVKLLLAGRVQEIGPGESVIYKPRWGAFYDTPLKAHLHRQKVIGCG
jgi:nicotinamidase-related amidase